MKTISLRSFSREGPSITTEVLITHESEVIGRFIPIGLDTPQLRDHGPGQVDARVTPRPVLGGSFGQSRPAPKPGKKT